jgi:hypothetical protein
LAEPLIELRLFRVPAFSASLAAFALSIFVIAGIFPKVSWNQSQAARSRAARSWVPPPRR